jgi:GNS1/SUR4 family
MCKTHSVSHIIYIEPSCSQTTIISRLLVAPRFGYVQNVACHQILAHINFSVEKISHDDADHSICHRRVCRVFRQYVASSLIVTCVPTQPPAAYMHFTSTYFDGIIPHMGNCAGTETAAVSGCCLISIYLGLFINFYFETYKKPTKGKKAVANGNDLAANGNGLVSLVSTVLQPNMVYLISHLVSNTNEDTSIIESFRKLADPRSD